MIRCDKKYGFSLDGKCFCIACMCGEKYIDVEHDSKVK